MRISPIHDGAPYLPVAEAHAPTPEQLAAHREIIAAVSALNEAELLGENNELTFTIDTQTQRPIIQIRDKATKEVIRQIPPDYVLQAAAGLGG